jgi:hypothetical protein
MMFTKRLREGVRRGRIRSSVRIWTSPHVKVGGRYRMDEGHIVVDSIEPIGFDDITYDLARESGFESVDALLEIAKHGKGNRVYLVRFHYLPPGGWDTPRTPPGSLEPSTDSPRTARRRSAPTSAARRPSSRGRSGGESG